MGTAHVAEELGLCSHGHACQADDTPSQNSSTPRSSKHYRGKQMEMSFTTQNTSEGTMKTEKYVMILALEM